MLADGSCGKKKESTYLAAGKAGPQQRFTEREKEGRTRVPGPAVGLE